MLILERNNKDIQLRWIKIECGSCLIRDRGGEQNEIELTSDVDYDDGFPELLRDALFCTVPVVVFHSMWICLIQTDPIGDIGDKSVFPSFFGIRRD